MSTVTPTEIPTVPLQSLDELWFQVSGTLCNLECTHCFISCSPHNDTFGYLSRETVQQSLEDSVARGVKEYYFTGGEPFLNRDIIPILEMSLEYGPTTVLTNATVLKTEWLKRLRSTEQGSRYSLEFRVSIDGPTPEINDPIRGPGTFARAMKGVGLLCKHDFLPIITMTRTWEIEADQQILTQFRKVLQEHGCTRPRLKVLPRLQIGAEANRTTGYGVHDRVTREMMDGYDQSQLICSHSRIVTSNGLYVCPILIDEPAAKLGDDLHAAEAAYPLRHGACYTCYQYGAICTNPSAKNFEG